MIKVRKSEERGHAEHGWLNTYHTFSFASYYDPDFNGFRSLRVINEDRVAPGKGFGTHPHADMEIISYVIDGALEHKDSAGNGTIIRKGEIQRMSAGTGVTHSEQNHSSTDEVHFLQIWLLPEAKGLKPGYDQLEYASGCNSNELCLIASHDNKKGSITVHQDVNIYSCNMKRGEECLYSVPIDRHQWIQVVNGNLSVNGTELATSDGCAVSEESLLEIESKSECEFLLFDLA